MADDRPPFDHVAIAGLGLIGGSIALGLRGRWPAVRVTAIDRNAVLAHAAGSGAIDRGVERLSDAGAPDLLILAAPVAQNLQLLEQAAGQLAAHTVITDVGGTKRDIQAVAQRLPEGGPVFVGGHPIGGAERGGFEFARPDLFAGRPWIFTPVQPPPPALAPLQALAEGLGARPATLDAERHDRLMSFLSHLPQLTATALMATVGDAVGAEGLALAGRGLVDTTRLASSPAAIWRDVCAANADVIGEALDALIDRLEAMRGDLAGGRAVEETFERAADWRATLTRGHE